MTAPIQQCPVADLPALALSVRQPWAWAIIHAGKDIENRSWQAVQRGGMCEGPLAIHAAKGMTRDEYDSAAGFMREIGVICPPPDELLRGGIIGRVNVVKIVRDDSSPWFFGPRGLILARPQACDFVPAVGSLGYFRWEATDGAPEPPAKWMLTALNSGADSASNEELQISMFGGAE